MTTRTKNEIQSEIRTLSAVEHLVSTNEGTFGAVDAHRKVGTGDPRYATRNVYATVDGRVRTEGPSDDDAPGYMRHINSAALSADRSRLAGLKAELKGAN